MTNLGRNCRDQRDLEDEEEMDRFLIDFEYESIAFNLDDNV